MMRLAQDAEAVAATAAEARAVAEPEMVCARSSDGDGTVFYRDGTVQQFSCSALCGWCGEGSTAVD